MSKIDVQTLVLAFEKRIESLEKNPPDKVPTSVVIKLLENAIDDVIKENFIFLIKKEMKQLIKDEGLSMIKEGYVKKIIENLFNNEDIKGKIEKSMNYKILKVLTDL